MAFHGFGGGSARMSELTMPTMFHCVYSKDTIYYSLTSLKGFNSSSRHQSKKVERKLPPLITRYFLLFRSLVNANSSLFEKSDVSLVFPKRIDKSDFGVAHVIRNHFNLDGVPDMTQVRQFWACVTNFISGGQQHSKYVTSSALAADRKSTRLNSSHPSISRMPSSA